MKRKAKGTIGVKPKRLREAAAVSSSEDNTNVQQKINFPVVKHTRPEYR